MSSLECNGKKEDSYSTSNAFKILKQDNTASIYLHSWTSQSP